MAKKTTNSIRDGESIKHWRDRIIKDNVYGNYGGELEPAVVTAEDTSKNNDVKRRARFLVERNQAIDSLIDRSDKNKVKLEDYIQSITDRREYGLWNAGATSVDSLLNATFLYENILSEGREDRLRSEKLRNLDEYYSLPVQHNIDKEEFNTVMQARPFKRALRRALESKGLYNIASQLYRYNSRHYGYQNSKALSDNVELFGTGADIIDLHNNAIRLTPDSKQSNALFNEFVESKYPSVLTAEEYKSNPNRLVGDMNKFPARNINVFAGIEDGKFKLDSLKNFNNSTTVIPARNIKKGLQKIAKINITNHNDESLNQYNQSMFGLMDKLGIHTDEQTLKEGFADGVYNRDDVFKWLDDKVSKLYPDNLSYDELRKQPLLLAMDKFKREHTDEYAWDLISNLAWYGGDKDARKIFEDVRDKHFDNVVKAQPYYNAMDAARAEAMRGGKSETRYTFIGEDGIEYPISDYKASVLDGKTLLGNENGSYFIGRLQDISQPQLDSLNSHLAKEPMWLMRTDLGSFDKYRLGNPSLKDYLTQYFEHPNENDPNVYTVGTTTPNQLWKAGGGDMPTVSSKDNTKVNKPVRSVQETPDELVDNVYEELPALTNVNILPSGVNLSKSLASTLVRRQAREDARNEFGQPDQYAPIHSGAYNMVGTNDTNGHQHRTYYNTFNRTWDRLQKKADRLERYRGIKRNTIDAIKEGDSEAFSKSLMAQNNFVAPYVGATVGGILGAEVLPGLLVNPYVTTGLNLIGTYGAVKHLASEDGIRKTFNYYRNNEPELASRSLAGDLLDATMPLGTIRSAKTAFNTGKEIALRMGDLAKQPARIGDVLSNPEFYDALINPKKYNLYTHNFTNEYKGKVYSGEDAASSVGHIGDVVDTYLGKSQVTGLKEIEMSPELKAFAEKTYGRKAKKIKAYRAVDEEGTELPLVHKWDNERDFDFLQDGEKNTIGNDNTHWKITAAESNLQGYDPGGFTTTYSRVGDDLIIDDWDMWKFNAAGQKGRGNTRGIEGGIDRFVESTLPKKLPRKAKAAVKDAMWGAVAKAIDSIDKTSHPFSMNRHYVVKNYFKASEFTDYFSAGYHGTPQISESEILDIINKEHINQLTDANTKVSFLKEGLKDFFWKKELDYMAKLQDAGVDASDYSKLLLDFEAQNNAHIQDVLNHFKYKEKINLKKSTTPVTDSDIDIAYKLAKDTDAAKSVEFTEEDFEPFTMANGGRLITTVTPTAVNLSSNLRNRLGKLYNKYDGYTEPTGNMQTSANDGYKKKLIDWAVSNEGALWADNKEAANARQWLRTNSPEDLDSLYWVMSDSNRSKVNPKFLSDTVKERLMADTVSSGINNVGNTILEGAHKVASVLPQTAGVVWAGNAMYDTATGNFKKAVGDVALGAAISGAGKLVGKGIIALGNASPTIQNGVNAVANTIDDIAYNGNAFSLKPEVKDKLMEASNRLAGKIENSKNPIWDKQNIVNKAIAKVRLPKSTINEVEKEVMAYNNMQREALGYDALDSTPFSTKIVTPTFREDAANWLGHTPSVVGNVRAGALQTDDGIKFFIPGLTSKGMEAPRHILSHEFRHGIQSTFKTDKAYSGLKSFDVHTSQERMPDSARDWQYAANGDSDYIDWLDIYHGKENPNLRDVDYLLYDRNADMPWYGSLHEFDADMQRMRSYFSVDSPYHKLPKDSAVRNAIKRNMAMKFNLTDNEADYIANTLSINGYKNGGKLK